MNNKSNIIRKHLQFLGSTVEDSCFNVTFENV